MGPVVEDAAIAVGAVNYGESHRIVRLLTPQYGRISVLARYARGSRKRFQGMLDLGNRLTVTCRRGKGELWHLDDADLVSSRLGARKDYGLMAQSAYCCEVASALAAEDHPEPALFGLLDVALVVLDALDGPPKRGFRVGFEAKALTFAGLAPSLERCRCGRLLDGALGLHGARVCHADCEPGGTEVTMAWVHAVEQARRTPLKDLVDTELVHGPVWAMSDAIEAHLERNLKSRRLLPEMSPTKALSGT